MVCLIASLGVIYIRIMAMETKTITLAQWINRISFMQFLESLEDWRSERITNELWFVREYFMEHEQSCTCDYDYLSKHPDTRYAIDYAQIIAQFVEYCHEHSLPAISPHK